ncbi:MAG TPA: ATP-binding protein [Cyclobacteriaceae bacterium]|nr:ATP-binding protein [Cyclobacteriaceae bacterium]
MLPGRAHQHPNHVIESEDENGFSVLRTAVIYGKNASGKSNFIKAINFAKNFITSQLSPTGTIPSVKPFRLDRSYLDKPSRFRFEIKIDDKSYDYGFSVTHKEVIEEWLFEIKKTSEKKLFSRNGKQIELGKIDYSLGITDSEKIVSEKQAAQRLAFVGDDTRLNQLFLSASVERNQPYFKHIYDWFDKSVVIIKPDSKHFGTEFIMNEKSNVTENASFVNSFEDILRVLDTGIEGMELQKVNIEQEFIKAYPYVDNLKSTLDEMGLGTKAIFPMPDRRRFAITKEKDGTINGFKMMTKHKMIGESKYDLFEINWESEGTQRLMDLIPSLFLLRRTPCTIFIDEMARSLHPELIYALIKVFLEKENLFKSQLVLTSHEDYLLNLDLLRRDEIWFVEKKEGSEMYSLEEFKPRYDKDIRKGYFDGRFRGIPMIDFESLEKTLEKV